MAVVLKTTVPQGTGGSNPSLSAIDFGALSGSGVIRVGSCLLTASA